jgi:hypothetical protein
MSRANSDENYVLDLCDEILGAKSERQKRFDFLLGDAGPSGRRRRLPVDAFYPTLGLAIEYREIQHTQSVKFFDKPHRLTVSHVHRGEQRKIYDERRRVELKANRIRLVEIEYDELIGDGRTRLRRDRSSDIATIKSRLEADGVEFTNGGQPGVRLKAK